MRFQGAALGGRVARCAASLAIMIALVGAPRGARAATSVIIDVFGLNYDVTTVNTTAAGWETYPTANYSTPFWFEEGNSAMFACQQLASQLGYPNQLGPSGTYGPYFAYEYANSGERRRRRQLLVGLEWKYWAYDNATQDCFQGGLSFASPGIAVFAYEDTITPIPNITANSTSVFTDQTITVDSLSSICPNSTCVSRTWELDCDNNLKANSSGDTWYITSGGNSAVVDMTNVNASETVYCELKLSVTDAAGIKRDDTLDISFTQPALAAYASVNGSGEVTAPGTIISDALNSTCFAGPCNATWTLLCANGYNATATGYVVEWTTGPNTSRIPMIGVSPPLICPLQFHLTNTVGQTNSTSTLITVVLSPPPVVVVDGINMTSYILINVTAGKVAPLVANRSTCANLPCTYVWDVQCDNGDNYTSSSTSPVATPLTGPGNAIDAPFDNTTTCNVSLAVTDVYGQSANSSDPVTLLINPANGPDPVINNGTAEINATGASSVTLTNAGTLCPAGNCNTTWALSCPDDRGSFSNRPGSSISVSVGSGGSFDIDTTGATEPFNCTVSMTVVDGNGLAATTSTILSASFSLAPPDCSLATFDPPVLQSRPYPSVCAANKQARTGRRVRRATNVTLSLPGAVINITNIVLDKASAGWKCRCKPTRKDNCTCVPNAALMGGGNFNVMPQWRRDIAPGTVADTILQVSFTATAAGGTCTGEAVICSTPNTRRNQLPPDCRPFNSTGVSRPALTCI